MHIELAAANDVDYPSPSWCQVEILIRSLDGSHVTDVFLYVEEGERYMAISGGNDGRYHIGVQEDQSRYYFLRKIEHGSDDLLIRVGDLDDYKPAELLHDLATALVAAKTYVETGERDSRFDWKQGGKT